MSDPAHHPGATAERPLTALGGAAATAAGHSSLAVQAARWALTAHRAKFDGTDSSMVRLPDSVAVDLVRRVAAGVRNRVLQVMPISEAALTAPREYGPVPNWRFAPNQNAMIAFAQAVSVNLAAQGCALQRVYLVPPGGLHASLVNRQIREDERAGIWSRALPISELGKVFVADFPLSLIWIVDNESVLFQEPTEAGPPVWAVSEREEDVERAGGFWRKVWPLATTELGDDGDDILTDPLLVSAEQIAAAAPMTCRNEYGGRRCSWYHGAWQYLRLFDMVSSPSWHKSFYHLELVQALEECARRGTEAAGDSRSAEPAGGPRVLITGAADYSMLAYVIDAWSRTRAAKFDLCDEPDIHVLDICPTPLLACRWYATTVANRAIETHECDLREDTDVKRLYESTGPFDLIVTDAFLTRFDHDGARAVMRHWSDLLAPGGKVVTTVRLHAADGPYQGPDEISEFTQRARLKAWHWRLQLRSSVDAICNDAREYALRITSTDFGGVKEVTSLLEEGGFELPVATVSDQVQGELRSTQYLRVVARKRTVVQSASEPERPE